MEPELEWNCRDWAKCFPASKRKEISLALTPNPDEFAILCLNVTGDQNLGTMIRTASLLGCTTFYIAGRKKWDKRLSVGAHHYINVVFLPDIYNIVIDTRHDHECKCGTCKTLNVPKFHDFIAKHGYTPIFLEHGGENILEPSNPWRSIEKPLFMFGNESFGIDPSIIQSTPNKHLLSIPQLGIMRSYNVATSLAIVVWEYQRMKLKNICT